jgi:hypothetical protein
MAEKPVKALVVINKKWTQQNGFSELLKPTHDNPDAIIAIVPVTEFNLEDGWFLEIEFNPASLNGRWVKLFVPKSQVVSIVMVQDVIDDEKDKFGFKLDNSDEVATAR